MVFLFGRQFQTILFVLALLAWQSPPSCAASDVVEGFGPLINGDLAQARDEALADARLRVIEKVTGVEVVARSVLAKELMVMSEVSTNSAGLISSEQILEEGMAGEGLYRVLLKAEVSASKARKGLLQLVQDDAIVLVLDEIDAEQPFFESHLSRELVSMNFVRIVRASASSVATLTDEQIKELAIRHMADVVLVGQTMAKERSRLAGSLYSAHGAGTLKAYRAKEGMVLASAQVREVRGFGNTPDSAKGNAFQEAAKSLTNDVLKSLVKTRSRAIQIVISDLPNYSHYKRCKAILSQMRWVSDVEAVRFDSGTGVYQVKVQEGVELLAARLDQFPEISVTQFDGERIRLHFKGK